MNSVRDFRTPADPEDFETTLARGADHPLDLQVRTDPDGSYVAFIQEPELPEGRTASSTYRVLYIAPGLIKKAATTARMLEAAVDLGEVAASVEGRHDGGRLRVGLGPFTGKQGWFAVVAISRLGNSTAPAGIVRSPAGAG